MIQANSEPATDVVPGTEATDYLLQAAEAHTVRSKAVGGAAFTAGSQIAKALLSIVSQVVLSRLLLPSQFGIVAMAAPVLAFVSLFNDLGLSQAVIQREKVTHEEINTLYWVGLSASSACALIVVALSPLVSLMYHQKGAGPVCAALALNMPIGALAGHSSALMARRMRFGAMAFMEVLSQFVILGVSIASAYAGAGYWSLVLGQIAGNITQVIGDRHFAGWRPTRPKWTTTALPMLKFGANLTGFNMLSTFSLYADNVLVGLLRGPGALGLFDKSFSLVLRPVGSITAPISRIATPLLARIIGQPDSYRRAYISMLQAFIMLAAPGLVAGSVLAHQLVYTVLGKNWIGAAPIMSWICIAAIFAAFSGSSYWIFTSQDRSHDQLRCGFISSGLILVSMLVGLPWGPVGIAKSYAIFAPLVHGSFIWKATQEGPVRRMDVVRGVYPFVLALPCAAFAVHQFAGQLGTRPWIHLGISLLLSYLVTVLIVLVTPQGRQSATTLLRLRQSL